MIIENIPYITISDEYSFSITACVAMLMSFYGYDVARFNINDRFGQLTMSDESFNDSFYILNQKDGSNANRNLLVARTLIESIAPELNPMIVDSNIKTLRYSYIKRNIPIIVCGMFPLVSGRVPGAIIVKGYVGEYLIINDPRGNANTYYKSYYGENVLYSMNNIEQWVGGDNIKLLRLLSNI